MAKKTITKEHPLTAFRKANEIRQAAYKKSLPKAQIGQTVGPQNNYWFNNNAEKQAMENAKFRQSAARIRDNNSSEEAERDYGNLIKNYQPQGPIIPLADQVNALNQKYPYYEGFEEVPFKGGKNNIGWDNVSKKLDKGDKSTSKYYGTDPAPNVGTGMIKRKGGTVKSKKK
jgi:hypothetical protein